MTLLKIIQIYIKHLEQNYLLIGMKMITELSLMLILKNLLINPFLFYKKSIKSQEKKLMRELKKEIEFLKENLQREQIDHEKLSNLLLKWTTIAEKLKNNDKLKTANKIDHLVEEAKKNTGTQSGAYIKLSPACQ